MAETYVTPEAEDDEVEPGSVSYSAPEADAEETPPVVAEPPPTNPAATPYDLEIAEDEADLDELRAGLEGRSDKVDLDEDLVATYGSIRGFNEAREKGQELTEEQEIEEQSTLGELLYLGATQNTTMQTARIGAQNLVAAAVRPSWMDEEDPNYVVPLEELSGYGDNEKQLLLQAKNEKHLEYLKTQADFIKNYNDKFQNTDMYTWLGASTGTFLMESGQILGITYAAGATGGVVGGSVGLAALANKMKSVTYGIKNARLAWMARQATVGAAGASVEGLAAYSQGVIDARSAMQYPLYGAAGGAVLSGAGQLMYKMRGFDADGAPIYSTQKAPDPEVHATVQANRAAAIELAARREAGEALPQSPNDVPPIKTAYVSELEQPKRPNTPERDRRAAGDEDIDPAKIKEEDDLLSEYHKQLDEWEAKTDKEFEDYLAGKNTSEAHPGVTKTFLEKDVRIRLRPKGMHQVALQHLARDTKTLRPVMSQLAEGLKVTGIKLSQVRQALLRQGYQNEVEQVVFAKIDDVTGEIDVGAGFTSRASAHQDAVKVVLKPGTRILHSDDIADNTTAKSIMFGGGKLKESGKGRYVFEPEEVLTDGRPALTGGIHPHGKEIDFDEMQASAKFADEAPDDHDWESLYTPNSSAGAAMNIVGNEERLALEVNQIIDQYAKATVEDVHRGHNIGSSISRIKRLKASKSAWLRNNLRGISGAADAVTDANFDKNRGSSWDLRKDADDKADGALIERERQERFSAWQKEVREKKLKDQHGNPLPYRGDNGLSTFFQMHKEYAYHLEAQRTHGVTMPDWLKNIDSLQGSEQFFNKMLKQKLDYAQNPSLRAGDDVVRQPVSGTEKIKYYDNHTVRNQDKGRIKHYLDQNNRAVEEVYTELIHNRNLQTNPKANVDDARAIAKHMQEAYLLGRGNVEEVFNKAFAGNNTIEEAMKIIREAGLGLSEARLADLEVRWKAMKAQSSGSASFFNSRMKLNPVQPVRIAKYGPDGKQNGNITIRLMDFMEDDMYLGLNKYAEEANGWIHGALTPMVGLDNKPMMTKIEIDGKEVEVPVTFNSKGRIDMFMESMRKEKAARLEDVNKTSGSAKGMEDQTDEGTMERMFEHLTNRSSENPHELASISKALATIYTMGHGGISSMQEIGAVVAFGRAQGAVAIAESMKDMILDSVRFMKNGKFTQRQMDDWNEEILMAGMGVNMDNMRLRETLAAGDRAFSFGQINPNATRTQKFGRLVNKGQNFILKKGLQAPVTDWTEKLSYRAVQRRWRGKLGKVKSFDEMPLRDRDYWLRTGISRESMDKVIKMHNTKEIYTVTGELFNRRHNINKNHPDFDASAHQEYVYAMKWLVNNRMIQSNQYAAGMSGSDKGFWIPMLKHLKSFTLHGVTQQLDPMLRDFARDGKGVYQKAKAGNHSFHDGTMNHAVGLLTHGATLSTMGFIAALTRYYSDAARNWDKDDKWHEEHFKDFWTANRIMQIGIDRAGPLASLPMAYDATVGGFGTGADWNGFDIDMPLEDIVLGSSVWTPMDTWGKAGDAALEAGAKGLSGDNIRKMGKALGSWWGTAQAVNVFAEGMEQFAGIPATHSKGGQWNPAKMDTPFEKMAEIAADPLKKQKTFDFTKWKGNKRKENINKIGSDLGLWSK